MKIGFFGTPDVAKEVMDYFCKSHHEVVFAVSSIDKPQGRSKKLCAPPVKVCAEQHCVDIMQPINLKEDDYLDKIREYEADIFVVFAYGHIIPRSVFEIPPLGTINLHPSLLPEYRGAAPVQWALIDGKKKSGVTIQMIEEALDAGPVVVQEELEIGEDETADDLYKRAIPLGIELLDRAIRGLADQSITPLPQDHNKATHCKKITREIAHIDWSNDAETIHNLVRGLNPKPYTWTTFRGSEMKIVKTTLSYSEDIGSLKPGEITTFGKKGLFVGTGTRPLKIMQLQPAGKKIMDAPGFRNGARLEQGDFFE
jgi:methionyl-tRNA formyltransferase